MQEDFLSIKEFANLIRVHENTVRKMIKTGKLNAFRVGIGPKSPYRICRTEINRMSLIDFETVVNQAIDNKLSKYFLRIET